MEIGAQLYTVRNFCKDLVGFSETLKKVADIGYKTVQVSGTCAFDADWLKAVLQKNGLRCVLTHTPSARLQNEIDSVIANHTVFGCDRIGLGYYKFADLPADYEKFKKTYMPIAEAIRAGGKYFMFHNHDSEFQKIDGKPVLALLAENFPADLLGFTLDTFWVQAGGGDAADWLQALSGRVPCIHLKDYAYGRKMAVIGEGNLNFDRIFAAAEAAGTQYMLVEQDDCGDEDPFDCLRRSYAYLHSCGF